MWEKKGLDELDCRVPLLIRAPWISAASKGLRTSALAEQVSMMPTCVHTGSVDSWSDCLL